MPLLAQTLHRELVTFCDPIASTFAGAPPTRSIARIQWSDAFREYVSEITDRVGGALLTPLQASLQPAFADAARAGFLATLKLDRGLSARAAAEDMADAWRAGIRSFAGGAGGTVPPATTLYVFAAWTATAAPRDVIDDRRDILADRLEQLFSESRIVADPRLVEIAAAFHSATSGITALATNSSAITYA